jgi:hypothetical protein
METNLLNLFKHTCMSTTSKALLTAALPQAQSALPQAQCDSASKAKRKERAHPASCTVVVILLLLMEAILIVACASLSFCSVAL